MDVFPEHKWEPWLFRVTPRPFWNSLTNRRAYMDWLARRLNFTQMDDWYKLGPHDLAANHGVTLMYKYGKSPAGVVISTFEDHR